MAALRFALLLCFIFASKLSPKTIKTAYLLTVGSGGRSHLPGGPPSGNRMPGHRRTLHCLLLPVRTDPSVELLRRRGSLSDRQKEVLLLAQGLGSDDLRLRHEPLRLRIGFASVERGSRLPAEPAGTPQENLK